MDAKVRDGLVALTGTAQWQYQRDEAEFLTASVPGVSGIENDITLTLTPDGRDIQHDISDAFRRSAKLDAEELSVDTTSYRTVILAGASIRPTSAARSPDLPCCSSEISPSIRDQLGHDKPRAQQVSKGGRQWPHCFSQHGSRPSAPQPEPAPAADSVPGRAGRI